MGSSSPGGLTAAAMAVSFGVVTWFCVGRKSGSTVAASERLRFVVIDGDLVGLGQCLTG